MTPSSSEAVRILFVEDNAITAWALQLQLQRRGYHVALAATGDKALELARSEEPEVVVTDIHLPGGMTGIEVVRRIREFSDPVVLFVSGYEDRAIAERARSSGALYLVKPVTIDQLVQSIEDSRRERAGGGA